MGGSHDRQLGAYRPGCCIFDWARQEVGCTPEPLPAWPEPLIEINGNATLCGVVIFKGELL